MKLDEGDSGQEDRDLLMLLGSKISIRVGEIVMWLFEDSLGCDEQIAFGQQLVELAEGFRQRASNGSRLSNPKILDLLTSRRPHRITLSVYGASAASYDGLTRRKRAFRMFEKGLHAGHEAGLPLALSMIVTRHNAHEVDQMRAMAERLGLPCDEYVNMAPTIYGGAETLPSQSAEHLRKGKVFTGCNAGHTFFHVDPHGRASICKVGRDPQISLLDEGVEGLRRLGGIADGLLLRQGGCTGCTLSGTYDTCMPLVQLYRKAKAPLVTYCQHKQRKEDAR